MGENSLSIEGMVRGFMDRHDIIGRDIQHMGLGLLGGVVLTVAAIDGYKFFTGAERQPTAAVQLDRSSDIDQYETKLQEKLYATIDAIAEPHLRRAGLTANKLADSDFDCVDLTASAGRPALLARDAQGGTLTNIQMCYDNAKGLTYTGTPLVGENDVPVAAESLPNNLIWLQSEVKSSEAAEDLRAAVRTSKGIKKQATPSPAG